MLTLLDKLMGGIAPHACLGCGIDGPLLCSACIMLLPDEMPKCYRCGGTTKKFATCASCRKSSPLDQVWIVTPYEAAGASLIKKLKFGRALAAAETAATAMAMQYGEQLPQGAILVPVPTATRRVRQRGYDQSVQIAKHLSNLTGLPCRRLLLRSGQQRQTGSTRTQRLAQLEDRFHLRAREAGSIEHAILIDDVLTTGATLEVAAKVLKRAGVGRVSAAVFARSE